MQVKSYHGIERAALLIVDDQQQNITLLARILARAGFTDIATTTDPTRAADLYAKHRADLVLLDLHMPVLDGFAVLEQLSPFTQGSEHLPVVMLTGDDSAESKRKALALGAKDFIGKPFDPAEVVLRIRNLLETRFLYKALRGQNTELEQKVSERTRELEESQVEVLERLAGAVEFRDDDTGDHTRRVGAVSGQLAEMMGLAANSVELIKRAAPLHDIGKVGIPDRILLKPGSLSKEEFDIMKTHTVIGSNMLSKGRSELVRFSQRIARSHHEKWNGSGYPDGLAGESIPLEARVVAVADFLDALTHERPYRAAWSLSDTLKAIREGSGSHFDPSVVKALTRIDWRSGSNSLVPKLA